MVNAKKAEPDDLLGRFREIVSDPLNLLIPRHPLAGAVEQGLVVLHNGNRVPLTGPNAYYGRFSEILVINRGVHEPLEEYVFHRVLAVLPPRPRMLELGSYWAHYSMWLKAERPYAETFMVDCDGRSLAVGVANFERNGFVGDFKRANVGGDEFTVDAYGPLDILHMDIQGDELIALAGCSGSSLRLCRIDYLFISTHSQDLHHRTVEAVQKAGYRVEIAVDFDHETTAFDGFVFALSPRLRPLFAEFLPLTRRQIAEASPAELSRYICERL